MKRTLITAGVATVFATLGLAAYAHGDSQQRRQPCTQADGKACSADGKGTHRNDGKSGQMQSNMQGMRGKHGDMEKNHARMAGMHARMHGVGAAPDKDGTDSKDGEHKH